MATKRVTTLELNMTSRNAKAFLADLQHQATETRKKMGELTLEMARVSEAYAKGLDVDGKALDSEGVKKTADRIQEMKTQIEQYKQQIKVFETLSDGAIRDINKLGKALDGVAKMSLKELNAALAEYNKKLQNLGKDENFTKDITFLMQYQNVAREAAQRTKELKAGTLELVESLKRGFANLDRPLNEIPGLIDVMKKNLDRFATPDKKLNKLIDDFTAFGQKGEKATASMTTLENKLKEFRGKLAEGSQDHAFITAIMQEMDDARKKALEASDAYNQAVGEKNRIKLDIELGKVKADDVKDQLASLDTIITDEEKKVNKLSTVWQYWGREASSNVERIIKTLNSGKEAFEDFADLTGQLERGELTGADASKLFATLSSRLPYVAKELRADYVAAMQQVFDADLPIDKLEANLALLRDKFKLIADSDPAQASVILDLMTKIQDRINKLRSTAAAGQSRSIMAYLYGTPQENQELIDAQDELNRRTDAYNRKRLDVESQLDDIADKRQAQAGNIEEHMREEDRLQTDIAKATQDRAEAETNLNNARAAEEQAQQRISDIEGQRAQKQQEAEEHEANARRIATEIEQKKTRIRELEAQITAENERQAHAAEQSAQDAARKEQLDRELRQQQEELQQLKDTQTAINAEVTEQQGIASQLAGINTQLSDNESKRLAIEQQITEELEKQKGSALSQSEAEATLSAMKDQGRLLSNAMQVIDKSKDFMTDNGQTLFERNKDKLEQDVKDCVEELNKSLRKLGFGEIFIDLNKNMEEQGARLYQTMGTQASRLADIFKNTRQEVAQIQQTYGEVNPEAAARRTIEAEQKAVQDAKILIQEFNMSLMDMGAKPIEFNEQRFLSALRGGTDAFADFVSQVQGQSEVLDASVQHSNQLIDQQILSIQNQMQERKRVADELQQQREHGMYGLAPSKEEEKEWKSIQDELKKTLKYLDQMERQLGEDMPEDAKFLRKTIDDALFKMGASAKEFFQYIPQQMRQAYLDAFKQMGEWANEDFFYNLGETQYDKNGKKRGFKFDKEKVMEAGFGTEDMYSHDPEGMFSDAAVQVEVLDDIFKHVSMDFVANLKKIISEGGDMDVFIRDMEDDINRFYQILANNGQSIEEGINDNIDNPFVRVLKHMEETLEVAHHLRDEQNPDAAMMGMADGPVPDRIREIADFHRNALEELQRYKQERLDHDKWYDKQEYEWKIQYHQQALNNIADIDDERRIKELQYEKQHNIKISQMAHQAANRQADTSTIDSLYAQRDRLNDEREALIRQQEELNQKKKEGINYDQQAADLADKIRLKTEEIGKTQEKIEELKNKQPEGATDTTAAQSEITTLTTETETLDATRKQEAEAAETARQAEKSLEEQLLDTADAKQKLAEATALLTSAQQTYDQHDNQVNNLKQQLTDLQNNRPTGNGDTTDYDKEEERLKAELETAERLRNEQQTKVDTIRQSVKALQDEDSQMKVNLERMHQIGDAELSALKNSISEQLRHMGPVTEDNIDKYNQLKQVLHDINDEERLRSENVSRVTNLQAAAAAEMLNNPANFAPDELKRASDELKQYTQQEALSAEEQRHINDAMAIYEQHLKAQQHAQERSRMEYQLTMNSAEGLKNFSDDAVKKQAEYWKGELEWLQANKAAIEDIAEAGRNYDLFHKEQMDRNANEVKRLLGAYGDDGKANTVAQYQEGIRRAHQMREDGMVDDNDTFVKYLAASNADMNRLQEQEKNASALAEIMNKNYAEFSRQTLQQTISQFEKLLEAERAAGRGVDEYTDLLADMKSKLTEDNDKWFRDVLSNTKNYSTQEINEALRMAEESMRKNSDEDLRALTTNVKKEMDAFAQEGKISLMAQQLMNIADLSRDAEKAQLSFWTSVRDNASSSAEQVKNAEKAIEVINNKVTERGSATFDEYDGMRHEDGSLSTGTKTIGDLRKDVVDLTAYRETLVATDDEAIKTAKLIKELNEVIRYHDESAKSPTGISVEQLKHDAEEIYKALTGIESAYKDFESELRKTQDELDRKSTEKTDVDARMQQILDEAGLTERMESEGRGGWRGALSRFWNSISSEDESLDDALQNLRETNAEFAELERRSQSLASSIESLKLEVEQLAKQGPEGDWEGISGQLDLSSYSMRTIDESIKKVQAYMQEIHMDNADGAREYQQYQNLLDKMIEAKTRWTEENFRQTVHEQLEDLREEFMDANGKWDFEAMSPKQMERAKKVMSEYRESVSLNAVDDDGNNVRERLQDDIAELERVKKAANEVEVYVDRSTKEIKEYYTDAFEQAGDIIAGNFDGTLKDAEEIKKTLEEALGGLELSDTENLEEYRKRIDELKTALDKLRGKGKSNGGGGSANSALVLTDKELREIAKNPAAASFEKLQAAMKQLSERAQQITKDGKIQSIYRLTSQGNGVMVRGSQVAGEYAQALHRIQRRMNDMKPDVKGTATVLENAISRLKSYVLVYVGFQQLVDKMKQFYQMNLQLTDSISNVQKVSGLTREEVNKLSDSLQELNTRTSQSELFKIAYQGSKMGVALNGGRAALAAFTESANKVNLALGEDFGGADAIGNLTKLTQVMKITGKENEHLSEALEKTGSAILVLGNSSTANYSYIEQFASRLGGIAQAARIAMPDLLAIGSTLDTMKMPAEMAATAMTKFIATLSKKPENIEKAIGLESGSLQNLIKTGDTMGAIMRVFQQLYEKRANLKDVANVLKDLVGGGNNTRALQVLTQMANGYKTLAQHVEWSNDAFERGSAIQNEYEVMNENGAASAQRFVNAIQNIFVNSSMGDFFAKLAKSMADIAEYFNKNRIALMAFFGILFTQMSIAKWHTMTWRQQLIAVGDAFNFIGKAIGKMLKFGFMLAISDLSSKVISKLQLASQWAKELTNNQAQAHEEEIKQKRTVKEIIDKMKQLGSATAEYWKLNNTLYKKLTDMVSVEELLEQKIVDKKGKVIGLAKAYDVLAKKIHEAAMLEQGDRMRSEVVSDYFRQLTSMKADLKASAHAVYDKMTDEQKLNFDPDKAVDEYVNTLMNAVADNPRGWRDTKVIAAQQGLFGLDNQQNQTGYKDRGVGTAVYDLFTTNPIKTGSATWDWISNGVSNVAAGDDWNKDNNINSVRARHGIDIDEGLASQALDMYNLMDMNVEKLREITEVFGYKSKSVDELIGEYGAGFEPSGNDKKDRDKEWEAALMKLKEHYEEMNEVERNARLNGLVSEQTYNRRKESLQIEAAQKEVLLRKKFAKEMTAKEFADFKNWWDNIAKIRSVKWDVVDKETAEYNKKTKTGWTVQERQKNYLEAAKRDNDALEVEQKRKEQILTEMRKQRPYEELAFNIQDNIGALGLFKTSDLKAEIERLNEVFSIVRNAYKNGASSIKKAVEDAKIGEAWGLDEREIELLVSRIEEFAGQYEEVVRKEANRMKKIMEQEYKLGGDDSWDMYKERVNTLTDKIRDRFAQWESAGFGGSFLGLQSSDTQAYRSAQQKLAIAQAEMLDIESRRTNELKDAVAQGKKEADMQQIREKWEILEIEKKKELIGLNQEIAKQQEEMAIKVYGFLKQYSDLANETLSQVVNAGATLRSDNALQDAKTAFNKSRGIGLERSEYVIYSSDKDNPYQTKWLNEEERIEMERKIAMKNAQADAATEYLNKWGEKMAQDITDAMQRRLNDQSVMTAEEEAEQQRLHMTQERVNLQKAAEEDFTRTFQRELQSRIDAMVTFAETMEQLNRKAYGGGQMTASDAMNVAQAASGAKNAVDESGKATSEFYVGVSQFAESEQPASPFVNWMGDNAPEVTMANWGDAFGGFIQQQIEQGTELGKTYEMIFSNIKSESKDTGTVMAKSTKSAMSSMVQSANMYGVVYQTMMNDNLSATQKFGTIMLQTLGQVMMGMITAMVSETIATNAANGAKAIGKAFADHNFWIAMGIAAAASSAIAAATALATTKLNKGKSEIASATGASSGRLTTGMLTYATGRYNDDEELLKKGRVTSGMLTMADGYQPGQSYAVDGADGKSYNAKYAGSVSDMGTGLVRGTHFGIFSEVKPETVIDGDTTAIIHSKYPFLENAWLQVARTGQLNMQDMLGLDYASISRTIDTLSRNGALGGVPRLSGMRMPTFANGRYPEQEGMQFVDAGGFAVDGYQSYDNAEERASRDRLSAAIEALVRDGVHATMSTHDASKKLARQKRFEQRAGISDGLYGN